MDEFGEGEADPLGGSVSITADTKPWEAALDRAAAKMDAWGEKVKSILDKASQFNETKLKEWGKNLSALSEQTGEQIGAKLGNKIGTYIGGALGTLLGPGLGTMIGSELGGVIGDEIGSRLSEIDTEGLFGSLAGALAPAGEAIDVLRNGVSGIQFDADMTFRNIKNLFSDFDPSELLGPNSAKAWEGLKEKANAAWDQIGEFAERTAFRISDSLNNAFELIKEPIAAALDAIQKVLVEIGLAPEKTAPWGDSIREIGDFTKTLFGNFAYGFGVVEGLVKKLGGYILEYVGLPIAGMGSSIISGIGVAIQGIMQLITDSVPESFLPSGFADGVQRAGRKLEELQAKFDKNLDAAVSKAQGLQNTDILKNAEARRQQAIAGFDKTKENVEAQNFLKEMIDAMMAELEAVTKMEFAKPEIAAGGAVSSKAILDRSQEAANIIARAQSPNAISIQQRAADAAIQGAKDQKRTADTLDAILKQLGESMIVESV